MAKGFKGWDMNAVNSAIKKGGKLIYADDLIRAAFTPLPNDPPRINKYRNSITEVDGIKFHSKLESTRYLQLKLLKAAGMITEFYIQQTYCLEVNGHHICRYIADFAVEWKNGHTTVEDTKGVETPEFRIKKKLMLAIHGIEIILIKSNINNNEKSKKSTRSAKRTKA